MSQCDSAMQRRTLSVLMIRTLSLTNEKDTSNEFGRNNIRSIGSQKYGTDKRLVITTAC